MDKITRASIADLLINISAWWFGLALGSLFLANQGLIGKILLLIGDSFFGMITLLIAIKLRRRLKNV
jgi:hypothetical protein